MKKPFTLTHFQIQRLSKNVFICDKNDDFQRHLKSLKTFDVRFIIINSWNIIFQLSKDYTGKKHTKQYINNLWHLSNINQQMLKFLYNNVSNHNQNNKSEVNHYRDALLHK